MFFCVENRVCEYGVCSVYIGWWLKFRESSLRVCNALYPVCFPIVGGCVFVCCSLYVVRVLIVVIMEGDLSLVRVLCARLCGCIMLWKLL